MAGIENIQDNQPIAVGIGNCTKDSCVEKELENFVINVFFDGTGNNRYNTYLRLDEKNPKAQEIIKLDREIAKIQRDYDQARTVAAGASKMASDIPKGQRMGIDLDQWSDDLNKKSFELKNKLEELRQQKEALGDTGNTHFANNKSYSNEFTNVALLEMSSKVDKKTSYNLYIEGAGTKKLEDDQTSGLGFAMGETGVIARVGEAFKEIQEIINEAKKANKEPNKITLNVFGFSRGSFYARHFCVQAKTVPLSKKEQRERELEYAQFLASGALDYKLKQAEALEKILARGKLQLTPEKINIRFVGIYDTVSSYGVFDHYDDPSEIEMSIGKKEEIFKVVHITAQDEFREHFPLTPVYTALNDGIAIEMSFPGAHSNIGGSYTDHFLEEHHYLSWGTRELTKKEGFPGEIHWEWWVQRGYYQNPENLKVWHRKIKLMTMNEDHQLNGVVMGYRTIRHHYQYVHLNSMKYCAEEFGKLTFDLEQNREYKERNQWFEDQKNNDDVLAKMDEKIQEFVKENAYEKGEKKFLIRDALSTPEEKRYFYNHYICNSLYPQPSPYGKNLIPGKIKRGLDPYEESAILAGVENEGTNKNQTDYGLPQRRIVTSGG